MSDEPLEDNPEDTIQVWIIEPHPYDSQFDSACERDYQKALTIAKDAVDNMMDCATDDELDEGKILIIKIKRVKMTTQEYEELTTNE